MGAVSALGLLKIAEDAPEWRKPSPAALCERVGLSRKRERRSKPAVPAKSICDSPAVIPGREARARNPLRLASCHQMDSGLAPKRARPRNDGVGTQ